LNKLMHMCRNTEFLLINSTFLAVLLKRLKPGHSFLSESKQNVLIINANQIEFYRWMLYWYKIF